MSYQPVYWDTENAKRLESAARLINEVLDEIWYDKVLLECQMSKAEIAYSGAISAALRVARHIVLDQIVRTSE